ncbi:MAG: hypothetical protein H0T75_17155 [Rhizobiales bacterium]|nr:hypothetical protein [Hyphomicrobiales bacterium]
MPRSTVGAVLRWLGLGRLAALDPKPPAVRYERKHPGELIHIDIKKLGKIDGVGHRITGQHSGMRKNRGIGWEHLHVCVNDAYTEILPDEKKGSACAFLTRALAFFRPMASFLPRPTGCRRFSQNSAETRSFKTKNAFSAKLSTASSIANGGSASMLCDIQISSNALTTASRSSLLAAAISKATYSNDNISCDAETVA